MLHPHANPPKARVAGLLVSQVNDDTIIYDEERKEAHTLNRTASFVWRHCDGQTSASQLALLLGGELGAEDDGRIVEYALDNLFKARLLEADAVEPHPGVTRRDMLRRI